MMPPVLIWLVPVAILLHEVEEWNIVPWFARNFTGLPRKTSTSIRTFLVFFSILSFIWTFLATRIGSEPVAATLVGALALAALLNPPSTSTNPRQHPRQFPVRAGASVTPLSPQGER